MFELSSKEQAIFKKLRTPHSIQDFLDTIPQNHYGSLCDTCYSPRMALRKKKALCIEGAFLAATALWYHGQKPLLLDLKASNSDMDHVVALYQKNGYWGAISKTNHPVLRFRDPIYRTIRELALSYFHEYFLFTNGKKTLRSYSRPFSLKKFGIAWITAEEDLWDIAQALDESPHFKIIPQENKKHIRHASLIERKAGKMTEWKVRKGRRASREIG